MAPKYMVFTLLLTTCLVLAASVPVPCPFDPTICTCESLSSTYNFSRVICNASDLATFSAPPGVTYTALMLLIQNDLAYKLPARYFSLFSSISILNLANNGPVPVEQEFDKQAFEGTKIQTLNIYSIDGLIPAPVSFRPLGDNGLSSLTISRHGSTYLPDNLFSDLTLTRLSIQNTLITGISENAFATLKASLTDLALSNASLTTFPSSALIDLSKLESLDLHDNQMSKLPKGIFVYFPRVKYLDLSGNPLAADIETGSLNILPQKIGTLDLSNVGLTEVLNDLLLHNVNRSLTSLSLTNNDIRTIRVEDFIGAPKLQGLQLSHNPIWTIEKGSFQRLKYLHVIELTGTNLSSIDLTIFSNLGAHDTLYIILDDNNELKNVTLFSANDGPRSFYISLTQTGIQTMDSKIGVLLDQNEKSQVDISKNVNLQCEGLVWMAPYALCTKQVVAGSTFCADSNNTALIDYLKAACPNACDVYSTTRRTSTLTPYRTTSTPHRVSTSVTTPHPTTGASQSTASIVSILAVIIAFIMAN